MSATLTQTINPEARFLEAFALKEGHTLNGANPHLHGLRRDAIDHFKRLGFPAPKAEAWKYTPITRRLDGGYALSPKAKPTPLSPADVVPFLIPNLGAHVAVMVNGRFDPCLSNLTDVPENMIVCGLSEANEGHANLFNRHFGEYADASKEVFTALSTAFSRDGLFVYVPRHMVVKRPLHIVHLIHTPERLFLQPRILVVVDERSQMRIVESRCAVSDANTFSNTVMECSVGKHARVDHCLIQNEGADAVQVATLAAYQRGDSFFSTNTITLSGAVVRNNFSFLPDAEHCETHLHGLYIAGGKMHVDTHTLVDHAQPECFSNELYKGIIDEKATGVFNGKVYVRPDAQQTNAYQSNKTVLLTDTARMYAKPELEIYADDVKCSHGATTGQLDAEALFYLRSRGLTESMARNLLLTAFARDVLDYISLESVREYLDTVITRRLES